MTMLERLAFNVYLNLKDVKIEHLSSSFYILD